MSQMKEQTAGWREYVSLPEWGIEGVLAKLDTGARTSAIHAEDLREIGEDKVRFKVVLSRRNRRRRVTVRARISRRSRVRWSNGQMQKRYVVKTRMRLGNVEKEIEISLVRRDEMICRMLLGRRALQGSLLVDPGRRFVLSAKPSLKKVKT